MEIANENIKVYQSSTSKVPLILFAICALLVMFLFAVTFPIIITFFLLVFFLSMGIIIVVSSMSLRITINTDKEVVTIEKINFLGNVVETKEYPLDRYYFERRFVILVRNRRRDCFSFSNNSYEGGELYYNKEFYTDDYSIEGLSKKTVQLIESDIQKIQDKKGLVVTAEFKR